MKITINGSSYEAEAEATLVFLLRPNELRAAQATRAEQVAASGWDRDDPQRTQSRTQDLPRRPRSDRGGVRRRAPHRPPRSLTLEAGGAARVNRRQVAIGKFSRAACMTTLHSWLNRAKRFPALACL
jgi:hypothetical protein